MKQLEKIGKLIGWKNFLLTGMLISECLSFLLQAIVFCAGKVGISVGTRNGMDIVAALIGVILFGLAFICYRREIDEENHGKKYLMQWWCDGIVVLIVAVLGKMLPQMLFMYLTLVSPIVAVVAYVLCFLSLCILCIGAVMVLAFDIQAKEELVQKKNLLKLVAKKPGIIFATIAVCAWFAVGKDFISLLLLKTILRVDNAFILMLMDRFVSALIGAFILMKYLEYIVKKRDVVYSSDVPARTTEVTLQKKIFVYAVSCIAIVGVIGNMAWNRKEYDALYANEYITELMESASKAVKYGQSEEAIRIYVKVEDYLEALTGYIDEDTEAVRQYWQNNRSDDFYWRLLYTMTDDIFMVEDALLESQADTRLCHDILRYYKEEAIEEKTAEEEDNEKEKVFEEPVREAVDIEEAVAKEKARKEIIDDCIWICMSRGAFVDTTMKFHKDSLRKKTVNDMKKEYEEILSYNELLLTLQTCETTGYVNKQTANKLIELANANPDNMAYQLMAVLGGSQHLNDKASHYKYVVECAKRLNQLMEQETKDLESIVDEKLQLTQMVMNCEDYATALEFLETVRDTGNADVEDSILTCYLELNENEKLIAYVDTLRAKGADRAIMDYLCALANLRLINVEGALENGVRLAEKVMAGGEDCEKNNALLYSLAQYLCISDDFKGYIDYGYRVKTYTEEQLAILDKSVLLKNYIDALNALFHLRDYDAATVALDNIDAVMPGLSKTWYLRGTLNFEYKEYDKAIDCFNKCISIDEDNITAVYSLAVLYDIKGEYEVSARLCEQILAVLPEVNHEIDWYGVSYHTKALYKELQKYIGGGK